jgi:hypothetical protein
MPTRLLIAETLVKRSTLGDRSVVIRVRRHNLLVVTRACASTGSGATLPHLALVTVATGREDRRYSGFNAENVATIFVYNVCDNLLEVRLDQVKTRRNIATRQEGTKPLLRTS